MNEVIWNIYVTYSAAVCLRTPYTLIPSANTRPPLGLHFALTGFDLIPLLVLAMCMPGSICSPPSRMAWHVLHG